MFFFFLLKAALELIVCKTRGAMTWAAHGTSEAANSRSPLTPFFSLNLFRPCICGATVPGPSELLLGNHSDRRTLGCDEDVDSGWGVWAYVTMEEKWTGKQGSMRPRSLCLHRQDHFPLVIKLTEIFQTKDKSEKMSFSSFWPGKEKLIKCKWYRKKIAKMYIKQQQHKKNQDISRTRTETIFFLSRLFCPTRRHLREQNRRTEGGGTRY